MKCLVYAVLLGMFSASASNGQIVGPIRTGFALVTPITAGPLALGISETLIEQIDGNVVQTSFPPSPLVTFTSIPVDLNPSSGVTAGIAILDPFDLSATVSLSLVNQQGMIISARTFIVPGRQQRSRFVTELFAGAPELRFPFAGQLFIGSNVPIAVLGLAFTGPFFTAITTTGQLRGSGDFPIIIPMTPGTSLIPFAGVTSFFFPQIVIGGGWATKITIANTSALPQSVRVDFFDSTERLPGSPLTFTIPNTIIQPGGVVTLPPAR